jgi:spore maturation protein SpmA
MLNTLWLGLILISVLLGGFTGKLEAVTSGAFSAAKDAVMIVALPMAGLMGLWLGFLRLAELSGVVESLARLLHPILRKLFPEVPEGHPAMGSMVLNMAANMLGLGNAATPFGLRAMRDLEKLNPHPGTATNAMCTFLAINTSSIQLVPATAIAILAAQGSSQPTAVLAPALLASASAAIAGICSVKLLQRLPIFKAPTTPISLPSKDGGDTSTPTPAATQEAPPEASPERTMPKSLTGKAIVCLVLLACAFLLLGSCMLVPEPFERFIRSLGENFPAFSSLKVPRAPEVLSSQAPLAKALGVLSLLAVPFLLAFFALFAALRGIKVYEEFVTGAKEGWQVSMRIIPYLLAILVGVRMFREAGAVEILAGVLVPVLKPLGIETDILPLILVRPLSGSATTGLFTELVSKFGPDSLIARTAASIYGSTETTFYVLAVYFGSVAVQRGRHALAAGLLADATGALASIFICRWLFT